MTKFDDIYRDKDDHWSTDHSGTYLFKGSRVCRCHICRDHTTWIDGDFMLYICSEECMEILHEDFKNSLLQIEDEVF